MTTHPTPTDTLAAATIRNTVVRGAAHRLLQLALDCINDSGRFDLAYVLIEHVRDLIAGTGADGVQQRQLSAQLDDRVARRVEITLARLPIDQYSAIAAIRDRTAPHPPRETYPA